MMTDIIIVGAGTAGLSAAIYGVRAGKSVIVFESEVYGGQIVNTPEIENYPGIKNISGFEFATNLYEQATELGAEVKFEKVIGIEEAGAEKTVVPPSKKVAVKTPITSKTQLKSALNVLGTVIIQFPVIQTIVL